MSSDNAAAPGRDVTGGKAGSLPFDTSVGTGIPTAGNIHEIVQAIAPESRVVYVDYDPIVLAHARALLASSEAGATAYIDADLRDTGRILAKAAELLDFSQPMAVTMLTTLHAIPDADNPHAIIARVMDAVARGSYLAVSHSGLEFFAQEAKDAFGNIAGRIQQGFMVRSRAQVEGFFAGTDLVEPGLVAVEEWRPDPGASATGKSSLWGAVGRKR
jgi:hypothetical protein